MRFQIDFKVLFFLIAILLCASLATAQDVTKPYTFSPNTPASAAEVNANFDVLYEQINKLTDKLGSAIVQVVSFQRNDAPCSNVVIRTDDTIPQKEEGTEFLSVTITPKSADSKLLIDVNAFGSVDGGLNITTALFKDSDPNALAAISVTAPGNDYRVPILLSHHMTAGTVSPITFKVRIGESQGYHFTLNGMGCNKLYGGVAASSIRVMEIEN
ncbi:virulence factor Pgp3 [Desulfonema magnum]|uniref:pGP3 C-terminal domain-containing protein n=1 Tax=Desulfonema magnum TaxID=45655 RepID=A0A975BI34_9BACT|nr:virulence factor Pgp3 [Desulfonema magnum]QTA85718.1 Uncharacterized protein dnm_017320 [Desulfonema magnum]